ncbi:hypothetical protein KKF59_01450 [Patescibacteria group bacterium]|nr:hypothetical protein [Patescibacteria group bacterium]MBU1034864.1 hypothetical protein [Patescibacteria group bacterium]MBU1629794.1 hypothetical protein [Patescibacteria group bacterium]MBU1907779.1 hypothetical protein [Patescibacteria group bacterium]
MDEKDRERDLHRARISKTLMGIAQILLDQKLESMAEILLALDEVMEEFNNLRRELREKYTKDRLMRPPPQKTGTTPVPASPRVPTIIGKQGKPRTTRHCKPPPTKGRRH